jgi:hypothetical protein
MEKELGMKLFLFAIENGRLFLIRISEKNNYKNGRVLLQKKMTTNKTELPWHNSKLCPRFLKKKIRFQILLRLCFPFNFNFVFPNIRGTTLSHATRNF